MHGAEQQQARIRGAQTTINGAAADYRVNIGVGSRWCYQANSDHQHTAFYAGELGLIYNYSFEVKGRGSRHVIHVNDVDPGLFDDLVLGQSDPVLTFEDSVPPPGTDLIVVDAISRAPSRVTTYNDPRSSIICFTTGTWIKTPSGVKPVEALQVGDLVRTRDNGPQVLRWIGRREMTGARFVAMSNLRPVRLRKGALGPRLPDRDLWVSPRHRMVVAGPRAEILFNAPEVLVAAQDLINDRTITVDNQIRGTQYIHLLFDRHEIIEANGVETESFHPGHSLLNAVPQDQLDELYNLFPELRASPYHYGPLARRALSIHEAAILRC